MVFPSLFNSFVTLVSKLFNILGTALDQLFCKVVKGKPTIFENSHSNWNKKEYIFYLKNSVFSFLQYYKMNLGKKSIQLRALELELNLKIKWPSFTP